MLDDGSATLTLTFSQALPLNSRIVLEMPFMTNGAPSDEGSHSSTTITPENSTLNKASVYFHIKIDVTLGFINILVK